MVNKKSNQTESDKKPKPKKKTELKDSPKENTNLRRPIIFSAIIILAILLLIIFWGNIFPAKIPANDPYRIYNGYIFDKVPQTNFWRTNLTVGRQVNIMQFYYHPLELENLSINESIRPAMGRIFLRGGDFKIGYDTQLANLGITAIAGSEVAKITGKVLGINTKSGFTGDVGDAAIPIINCSNATNQTFVLEIRLDVENKITYSHNCAVIHAATPEDAVKLADLFSYTLLGIMPKKPDVKIKFN